MAMSTRIWRTRRRGSSITGENDTTTTSSARRESYMRKHYKEF
ncbi:hypothetical protein IHE45_08G095900 [Dioscorea alata]|uniref:Uncharacterized protein n=1 Tax=Dioscorea alata TaxID=55571 RepID=A0ACB7VL98_DIOAL|nr:hypothetical protein IHE45_08G095900 [Dioscorea alata]